MVDAEVREKFKEFQKRTGKYDDLDIDDVRFEKKKIDDVVSEFIKGSTPKYSPDTTDYVVIKSGQARGNYNEFNFKKMAYLDLSKVKTIKTLQKGDILINTTGVGTAGRVTLFDLDGNYVSDSHITALRYDLSLYNKFYLLYFFVNFGFKRLESMAEGTGGQIELSMELVKRIDIPIPKDLDKTYTCIKIQEAIVEFLEFWKDDYTDIIRERVSKKKPIYEAIKRIVVQNTFQYDEFLIKRFNRFVEDKNYDIKLESIKFDKIAFFNLVNVTNGSEFPSGYVKRTEVKGEIPLISAGVKKDVMGYIKSLKGNKNDEPSFHYVFNNTKNKWNKVNHYIGKDFYTLNADGEGGHIIKRSIQDYPNGFYTTNVCKVLDFDREKTIEKYFYFSYQSVKDKEKFGFAKKANNDNLAKVNLLLPVENEKFTSKELQELFVEFWEIIIGQIEDKLQNYKRMLELTELIDRAFLYRTFSKIDWSKV